jgi:hypothetical protein
MKPDSFTFAPPAQNCDTSRAAAKAIMPHAGTQRALVFAALQDAGLLGLTDQQIQDATGLDPSSERPRRIELCNAGLIVVAPFQRLTHADRLAQVWRCV